MILNHLKFDFENIPLIEKLAIKPPHRLGVSFQNEACFIYFSEGLGKVNSPTEQKSITPGESVLLKCGNFLAELEKSSAQQLEVLVIHLNPILLRKIYKEEIPAFIKGSASPSFITKIDAQDVIDNFINSLNFYFKHPSLATNEILELKVKELVLLLIQTNNASSLIELFSDLFTPRTATVKEVVGNHIFSGLSIEELASLANQSVSTFNRAFQNLFNDTPANYIKMKRLEKARDLLAISDLTISEIAFQTCFNDVAHFSRSFKAAFGCAPSEYRYSIKK